jgi:hypothetical protein
MTTVFLSAFLLLALVGLLRALYSFKEACKEHRSLWLRYIDITIHILLLILLFSLLGYEMGKRTQAKKIDVSQYIGTPEQSLDPQKIYSTLTGINSQGGSLLLLQSEDYGIVTYFQCLIPIQNIPERFTVEEDGVTIKPLPPEPTT